MVWKTIQLKDVMKQYKKVHFVEDSKTYRQITISQTGAVSFRCEKKGNKIGRKRQFFIDLKENPNTIIFTRQGIMKGSIGLVPEELDGCLVTENMPMFNIININPKFLGYYFKSIVFKRELRNLVPVGTAQKALHEKKLLKIKLKVPERKKQSEIVEKIEKTLSIYKDLKLKNQLNQNYIERLRQSILQEAVQGKLVPQDPNDETINVLLEKIKSKKEKLIKEKKIKKQKSLPPIKEEEKPFDLPKGWKWTRLGNIALIINGDRGKNYPSRNERVSSGIPFVNAGHLKNKKINFDNMDYITSNRFNLLRSGKFKKDDILYCIRGSLGKNALVFADQQGAIASSLVIIRNLISKFTNYILIYLSSNLASHNIKKYDNGTAQPNLGAKNLEKFLLPLPPINEQKLIVAKVDELMNYCDQLEEKVNENEQNVELLMQAVLKEAFEAK